MHWKQTWKMNLKESPPTSNLIKNLISTQSLTYLQLQQDKQFCHMADPIPKLKMNWDYRLSPEPLYAVEETFLFHWHSWCMHEQRPCKVVLNLITLIYTVISLALFVYGNAMTKT
jgi:hypothetical protein